MPNSLPPPPPPPPPPATTTASPSKSRLQTCRNSSQGLLQKMSVPNCLPPKGKRTRDLPNLSDCHGCGVRINYSKPNERLRPLGSFWRIVLLCKKCLKMVNSGQLCPYCFRDTANLVSDCVRCSDCERFIHQTCIVRYSGSPPWSYSCKESGSGFSVCVDCWVPKLLKNSARVCRRKEIPVKSRDELSASQCDSRVSVKGKDEVKSLEEVVKDANSIVENKVAVAIKAKEKALRKVVVAKNAVLLAGNALDLVAKECSSKKSEGLVASMNNDCDNEVSTFVDDAEFAFQLHRAMNSSPRISKNTCSMDRSCSDPLKLTDSCSVSPKLNDLGSGEDGKVAVCSNTLTKGIHDSKILEALACIGTNESHSAISSHWLKPELKTYQRINKKRKDFQENVVTYQRINKKRKDFQENAVNVGTSFDVAGKCTAGDGSQVVTEPQSCQLDELRQVFQVNDAWTSSLESCYTNIFTENWSSNRRYDRYAIKYKRMTGCRMGSNEEVNFRHEESNLDSVSFQKQTHASVPGLPMDCSVECRALSDSSLHSCVVNLQANASIGVSTQEEV